MSLPLDMQPADESPKPGSETPEPEAPPSAGNKPADQRATDFLVVGVGASAGALEPLSELFKRLPVDSNLAVILVQHLDPSHESALVELLRRVSSLPVEWAGHGQSVTPGNIYVAPPNSRLTLKQGVMLLREPKTPKIGGDIDFFLHSLAEDCKHRAVAIIMSGNLTDGTLGAKAVKENGGIVLAQDVSTASFPSMPRSVIASNSVDRVLAPADLAEELHKLTQHAPSLWKRMAVPDESAPFGTEAQQWTAILRLIALRTGVDFSEYKPTTIRRRLIRQMILSKSTELGDYLKRLQRDRDEVLKLYESLLINVTEFFRDPDYFEFLRTTIIPKILEAHPGDVPIRVWVPGCATGEEAYSLGMILREVLDEKGRMIPVQIFGTDVSERASAVARAGIYAAGEVANVSPQRLAKFFLHTERGYVIHKSIRDLCVFARQNVVKDSPFSRLDLISCRNLLIYLDPKLQRKLMPVFHYSLNPLGFLVLGSSESVGGHADLFRLVDPRFRIYSRKATGRRPILEMAIEPSLAGTPPPARLPAAVSQETKDADIVREADRIVLHRHGPTGVLVNDTLEILQFRGDVSAFLAPTPGRASLNLLRMAREGLAGELQAAINEAREKGVRTVRSNIPVFHDGMAKPVHVDVTPIDTPQSRDRFYLVLFTPADDAAPRKGLPDAASPGKPGPLAQVEQLRQDLEATRNYLHATIQKHEATNEELRAANEEIQSSNEELQSTNEELETAKEELQSTNEELTTVNEELHNRQLDLVQVNNDLHNLINSAHVPIVILGQDMRIRRFTPSAERVLKLIPTDIGRPLSDINTGLSVQELPRLMQDVVDTLTSREIEVQDGEGRWYSLRLRPYKTAENKIDGLVLALFDIDALKRSLAEVEEARNLAQAVIETSREPMVALTADLVIKTANDAFFRLFKTTRVQAEGRPLFAVVHEPAKQEVLKRALEAVLPTSTSLTNYEVGIDLPEAGPTAIIINVRQIAYGGRTYPLILLSLRTP